MKKLVTFFIVLSCTFLLVACGNNNNDSKDKDKNANNTPKEEVNQEGNVENNTEDNLVEEPENNEQENANEPNEPEDLGLKDDEKVEEDKVVVMVNGREVKGQKYNKTYLQAKAHLAQTGEDPNDKELAEELTLGSLIEQELILSDAEKEGIEVTEEEVQTQYEGAKEENAEELNAYLEQFELSEEEYKDRLHFAMIHDLYVAQVIEIPEVTEEEIEEVYALLKENDEDLPELEEVSQQLKMELSYQKEQEELYNKMLKLEEEAEIEELI